MVSEFPAGLNRQSVETIMDLDPDVLSHSRLNDAGAMWRVLVSVEGGEPVSLVVDNGINSIYLQVLIRLDDDSIVPSERNLLVAAALKALEPYSTVGLTCLGDGIYLRSAFFIDFCNMHAFSNTVKGIALAYAAYLKQLPITASTLQV